MLMAGLGFVFDPIFAGGAGARPLWLEHVDGPVCSTSAMTSLGILGF